MVSTDQAHSLGDVLGITVSPSQGEPVRVVADLETGQAEAGGGFLDALALDTLALLETVESKGMKLAIEERAFAEVSRKETGGKGFDGVVERSSAYLNPFFEILE